MEMTSYKVEFPRRQAMLKVMKNKKQTVGIEVRCWMETCEVPVLVWPMPTQDGYFIVEHRDGSCHKVRPHDLTFLDSKKLFDQYDWGEEA